ncbi:MAG: hypothetical protein M1813_000168 [Trichoglossum hirsutum]|nr:MAG: hypothetical protein M1813_000168 [Trichoglossum hirsutum]
MASTTTSPASKSISDFLSTIHHHLQTSSTPTLTSLSHLSSTNTRLHNHYKNLADGAGGLLADEAARVGGVYEDIEAYGKRIGELEGRVEGLEALVEELDTLADELDGKVKRLATTK